MHTLPWMATKTFYCRWARRQVTVECLTYDGRTPVGILSCSAFEDGSALPCGTPCIEWAARTASAPGRPDGGRAGAACG